MYPVFILLALTPQVCALAISSRDDLPTRLQHSSLIDHSASTHTLDIHTTDGAENDISKQIDINHHRSLDPANHRHEKRAIVPGPPGLVLMDTFCRRDISPQEYEHHCRDPRSDELIHIRGRCPPSEVCFQVSDLDYPPGAPIRWVQRANCVSRRDFAFFTNLNTPRGGSSSSSSLSSSSSSSSGSDRGRMVHTSQNVGAARAGLPATGVGSSQYALGAILTARDIHTSLNASSFRMQAKRSRNIHGHVSWYTLPGGSSQCTDCSSVSIDPVPEGTQTIALDIGMKVGAAVGTLMLGSVHV